MADGCTVEGMDIGGQGWGSSTIKVQKYADGSAQITQWFGNASCKAVTLHPSQVAYLLGVLDPSPPGSDQERLRGRGGRA